MSIVSPDYSPLLRGIFRIICISLIFLVTILLIRAVFPLTEEWLRKLVHIAAVTVIAVWLYAFPDWKTTVWTDVAFFIPVYLFLYFLEQADRLTFFSRITAERSKGELRKSLCAVCAMFLILVLVPWALLGERALALAALLAWGPGDAAAALVGKRFGKTKIGPGKKKSLEGTLSMAALSVASVLAVLLAFRTFPPPLAVFASLLTGGATAAVELYETKGFDTFFCPLTAALILCLLKLFFASV